jgi:hypothetical protein
VGVVIALWSVERRIIAANCCIDLKPCGKFHRKKLEVSKVSKLCNAKTSTALFQCFTLITASGLSRLASSAFDDSSATDFTVEGNKWMNENGGKLWARERKFFSERKLLW